ncbi:MAG: cytosine permease [Sedimentisphaeraceae bacterium JB056]
MGNKLPGYIKAASAVSMEQRTPWYKNTAPSYAGIFLSVPFMAGMASAIRYGSVTAAVVGLVLGAIFCFLLYYVSAKIGVTTGMPLYVIGSSTFGAKGGILMPGLLMGVLQIGWHSVFTFTAAKFFISAIGVDAHINSPLFWFICGVWGLSLALVGAVGINWLGWLSSWLPIFPLVMIIIAGIKNSSGLNNFSLAFASFDSVPSLIPVMGIGAFAAFQSAAGFFATAGAAGADFTMNNRNEKDVICGGLVGITLVAIVAGFFAIITMAGAMGIDAELLSKASMDNFNAFEIFIGSISVIKGAMSNLMFWIFVIACVCPTGFCAFLAGNAFSTMMPKLARVPLTLGAGLVGVILAATGVAENLVGFFLLIGASFGPIVGAMAADHFRSGKWPGPRRGINWAGYVAWACGFVVGILGHLPVIGFAYGLETLMSFVVGFTVYLILAGLGLEPQTDSIE